MRISLSPQQRNDKLAASVAGDVLTLNGLSFDFGLLPEGGTLPAGTLASEWFDDRAVTRVDGEIHVTLRLPFQGVPSSAVAFPEPIHVTEDGPIPLPTDEVSA